MTSEEDRRDFDALLARVPLPNRAKSELTAMMESDERHYHGVGHLALLCAAPSPLRGRRRPDRARDRNLDRVRDRLSRLRLRARAARQRGAIRSGLAARERGSAASEQDRNWVAETIRPTADDLAYPDPAADAPLRERARMWVLDLEAPASRRSRSATWSCRPNPPATSAPISPYSDPSLSTPAWKLFQPGPDLADLAGKIVVVGASASLLSDVVATPLNPSTPGVEAQAQLIEQIVDGDSLLRPDWAPGAEVATATLLSLALVVATPLLSALWSAVLGALAAAAMAGGSWLAFTHYGWLLDPITPSFSVRRGLPRRRAGALQPEAPSAERDPLALRTVRFPCGGGAAGRAPGGDSTGRPAAHADPDVLRHPRLHDAVRGPVGGRTHHVPERISDADDGRRAAADGHRRQIHGRRDHGVLERAARRRRSRRARGARRPGHAQDAGGVESALGEPGGRSRPRVSCK